PPYRWKAASREFPQATQEVPGPSHCAGFSLRVLTRGMENPHSRRARVSQQGRPEEANMRKIFPFLAAGTAAILLLCSEFVYSAPAEARQSRNAAPAAAADLVQTGTHFLVRLEEEMNTGKDKVNKKFAVKTMEPLEFSTGYVLPAGAKILGHISRIEPGGLTGRARLWLTFDDIATRRGTMPIVAEVASVPGEYSVRPGESKEGEIEARTSKG